MKKNSTEIVGLRTKVIEGTRKMILEQTGEYHTDKEIVEENKHIFYNIQNLKKEYEFLVDHGYIK